MSEPANLNRILADLGVAPSVSAAKRALRQIREAGLIPTHRPPVRVALMSSFNIDLLGPFVELALLRVGLPATVHTAPYGQFRQELLDPASSTATLAPDFTFLLVESDALFGAAAVSPLSVSTEDRAALLDRGWAELERLVAPFRAGDGAVTGRLVLHTFAPPARSPLGLADATHPAGLHRLHARLNDRLCELAQGSPRLAVFDFDAWLADAGRAGRADARMKFLARRELADARLPSLAAEYARVVCAGVGAVRKVLVLDLDNTLWGGIVGEDGPEGIRLGPDAPGNAFVALQQEVLELVRRGVVPAVCSKNNADDALEVLRGHPHMLLRDTDFAALAINWNDKVDNLRALAEELSLGLDSFVFLDDTARERENVRARLPQVLVPELPDEPADRPDFLRRLGCFDTLELTDEDRKRSKLYVQRRERMEISASAASAEDFRRDMGMKATIARVDRFTRSRLVQLAARTNQFNLTGRRWTPEQAAEFEASPNHLALLLSLTDRLGDHGIVGAAVLERADGSTWRLDNLMMSCRVLGWNVDTAFAAALCELAAGAGASRLLGEFIPSAKNAPAADFFDRHGFVCEPARAEDGIGVRRFSIDLARRPKYPEHLAIALPR